MPQVMIYTYEDYTDAQKKALVKDLTVSIYEPAKLGPQNVAIFFIPFQKNEVAYKGRLLSDFPEGSGPGEDDVPWLVVQIHMFGGRTLEQKREMVRRMTDDLVKHFGIAERKVQIIFSEMTPLTNAIGGFMHADKDGRP